MMRYGLQETVVSVAYERFHAQIPKQRSGIQARVFVSAVLTCASKDDFDWTQWEYPEEVDAARKLTGMLGRDLLDAFARLVRRRNAINHAGTNVQEPVSPTSPDYVTDGFLELADAVKRALMQLENL